MEISCRLTGADFRARREACARLWSRASGITELPDGFEIRFDPGGPDAAEILRLVEAERACCRFLRFALELEPGEGPIRLRITGPGETRTFLAEELGLRSGSPEPG